MSLWSHAQTSTGEPLLPPRLLLLEARRENLRAHSERLTRELDELTRQIDLELRRAKLAVPAGRETAEKPAA